MHAVDYDMNSQQGDQPPKEQRSEGVVNGHVMQDEGEQGGSICVSGGDVYIKARA